MSRTKCEITNTSKFHKNHIIAINQTPFIKQVQEMHEQLQQLNKKLLRHHYNTMT